MLLRIYHLNELIAEIEARPGLRLELVEEDDFIPTCPNCGSSPACIGYRPDFDNPARKLFECIGCGFVWPPAPASKATSANDHFIARRSLPNSPEAAARLLVNHPDPALADVGREYARHLGITLNELDLPESLPDTDPDVIALEPLAHKILDESGGVQYGGLKLAIEAIFGPGTNTGGAYRRAALDAIQRLNAKTTTTTTPEAAFNGSAAA
jgi:hypothetical protein